MVRAGGAIGVGDDFGSRGDGLTARTNGFGAFVADLREALKMKVDGSRGAAGARGGDAIWQLRSVSLALARDDAGSVTSWMPISRYAFQVLPTVRSWLRRYSSRMNNGRSLARSRIFSSWRCSRGGMVSLGSFTWATF